MLLLLNKIFLLLLKIFRCLLEDSGVLIDFFLSPFLITHYLLKIKYKLIPRQPNWLDLTD